MIVDLFAGPGGWSEGLATLGHRDIGVEHDLTACQTRVAAGHRTVRADVASMALAPFVGRVDGLIASPPCTDWSQAGKRAGLAGTTGHLVAEVDRWVRAIAPDWIACEQVPPALGVWERFADEWQQLGYSTWAGILNAADYGVPQTRRRAILIASRSRSVDRPPATHDKDATSALFGQLEPWVSMADALGWTGRVNTGRDWKTGGNRADAQTIPTSAPAPTIDSKGRWHIHADDGTMHRYNLADALVLQSFRPDYPVTGNTAKQFEQVGNAIPPRLAAHILATVL